MLCSIVSNWNSKAAVGPIPDFPITITMESSISPESLSADDFSVYFCLLSRSRRFASRWLLYMPVLWGWSSLSYVNVHRKSKHTRIQERTFEFSSSLVKSICTQNVQRSLKMINTKIYKFTFFFFFFQQNQLIKSDVRIKD